MLRNKFSALMIAGFCMALTLAGATAAMADDWVAVKLRGRVFAFNGADWVPLKRGDIVSDERVIRTTGGGRVQFQRDAETIDVGGNTQIRIYDRTGQRYTTVQQHFGVVTIEAERQNVQHFAVQTPFLAAVVKGTRFTVHSNDQEAKVDVVRGKVEVNDDEHDLRVNVTPGQSASAGEKRVLHAEGKGKVEPVVNSAGRAVVVEQVQAKLDEKIARKTQKRNDNEAKKAGKGKSPIVDDTLSGVAGLVSGKSKSSSNSDKKTGLSGLFGRGDDDKSNKGRSSGKGNDDKNHDRGRGNDNDKSSSKDSGKSDSHSRGNDKDDDKGRGNDKSKNDDKGHGNDKGKDKGSSKKSKGLVGGVLDGVGGLL